MNITKNLTEFFADFKKYRETKKDIANEDNFYDYVSLGASQDLVEKHPNSNELIPSDKLSGAGVNLEQGKVLIDIDVSKQEVKQEVWIDYQEKIEKVLKDIWATGKIKDTYGLDLDWPNNEKVKKTETSTPEPKGKNQKNSSNENTILNERPSQENNKIYWIIGSVGLVLFVALIYFLIKKKSK